MRPLKFLFLPFILAFDQAAFYFELFLTILSPSSPPSTLFSPHQIILLSHCEAQTSRQVAFYWFTLSRVCVYVARPATHKKYEWAWLCELCKCVAVCLNVELYDATCRLCEKVDNAWLWAVKYVWWGEGENKWVSGAFIWMEKKSMLRTTMSSVINRVSLYRPIRE